MGPAILTIDIITVLVILLFTILLFLAGIFPVDVVAVLVLVTLGMTQFLTPAELFSGFSSEAVISLIAIMVLSAGLERAGIAARLARWMVTWSKSHPKRILVTMMAIAGLMASFMRSLGTVALFLPIISRVSSRTGIAKNQLLMPVAFCAIMGGTLTMIGTGPLIILNSLLDSADQFVTRQSYLSLAPFGLFDVLPIGIALLLMSIVYFLTVGLRGLSAHKEKSSLSSTKAYFTKTYQKATDLFEFKINKNSPVIGMSLRSFESKLDLSCSVIAIQKDSEIHLPPLRKVKLEAGDKISIMGKKELLQEFADQNKFKSYPKLNTFAEILHSARAGLCEVVVPPSSSLIGVPVRELHMKRNYNAHVLALIRGNTIYRGEELKDIILRPGDTLGMYCRWDMLADLNNIPDFVVLTSRYPREKIRSKKMPHAIIFFLLALFLVIFLKYPLSISLLIGAAGIVASGVLTVDEAYQSVSWKTVFLLAGLIPLGLAMQKTGTADWLTDQCIGVCGILPAWIVQTLLAITTSFLALVVSNIGATVLMVPVALDLAVNIGMDPRELAMTVAISASNTFLIPTHQVNALIAAPGGYSVRDFIKIGSIMTILYWVVTLIIIKIMFN